MQVPKKSSRKALIVAIVVTLIVAICIIIYLTMMQTNDPSLNKQVDPTDNSQVSNDKPEDSSRTEKKNRLKPDSSEKAHEKEKDIQPPYEGEDPNNSPSITGVITYKSVVGSNLSLRTTIDQYLDSGTCKLTLTNSTKTVTRSSAIAQNPSSSTCEGFDVPTTELEGGTWNIEIIVTSGSRTGTLKDSVTL